jgi:hypothetical protein
MAISDSDISSALSAYLERYPDEAALLSEPVQLLCQGEFRLAADLSDARDCRRAAGPQ